MKLFLLLTHLASLAFGILFGIAGYGIFAAPVVAAAALIAGGAFAAFVMALLRMPGDD